MKDKLVTEELIVILSACKELIKNINNPVIAIDGRAASGKSTLAKIIAEEFSGAVVHADDFFLPFDLRTPERLAEPGGNLHYERFHEQVIDNIKKQVDISYGVFDCKTGAVSDHRTVSTGSPIIIEGAYSASPRFGKYYDMLIFVTASYDTQIKRIRERNGDDKLEMFQKRWIPLEEAYLSAYKIENSANIIYDTTKTDKLKQGESPWN